MTLVAICHEKMSKILLSSKKDILENNAHIHSDKNLYVKIRY